MKLARPLCYLDIESATAKGRPDAAVDRIICLAICKVRPDGSRTDVIWLFNPQIPITPENAAIHGYTNERVAAYKKLMSFHAVEIKDFIANSDLAGFNCLNYDVPLLWEECHRTLTAALKFYCGVDHTGAHGAVADVRATIDVLEAQVAGEKYVVVTPNIYSLAPGELAAVQDPNYTDLAAMDVAALAAYSKMDDRVDLFGTIVRNENGEAVFNTKRNQGVRVIDDTGYAQWMLRSDFPANTKMTIERILNQDLS